MFFLLRCVFWLSIVYASILSSDDWRHVPSSGRDALDKAGQTALTTAAHYCASRSTDCLSAAAQLTALIDAGATGSLPKAASRHAHDNESGRQTPRP